MLVSRIRTTPNPRSSAESSSFSPSPSPPFPLSLILVRAGKFGQFVTQCLQFLAAGHHREHLLAGDLGLIEGAVAAAPVEDGKTVTDRIGMVDVVRDEDDTDRRVRAPARL